MGSFNKDLTSQQAFRKALAGQGSQDPTRQAQGSHMVRSSQPGLHDGPKPPGFAHAAVKREQFNKDWRQEYRNALKAEGSRRMYHSFTQNAQQSRSI